MDQKYVLVYCKMSFNDGTVIERVFMLKGDFDRQGIITTVAPFLISPCKVEVRAFAMNTNGQMTDVVENLYQLLLPGQVPVPGSDVMAIEKFFLVMREDGREDLADSIAGAILSDKNKIKRLEEENQKLQQDVAELNQKLLDNMLGNQNVPLLEGPKPEDDRLVDDPLLDFDLDELLDNLPKDPKDKDPNKK